MRERYEGLELRGKRLGVVGLGAIGRRVAGLGVALDMDVVYWSSGVRGIRTSNWCEFDELLSGCRRRSDLRQR